MLVTIDIGNSRIKMATWQYGQLLHSIVSEHSVANLAAALKLDRITAESVDRVLVASVADQSVQQVLESALKDRLPAPEYFQTTSSCCGITHSYAEPSQHGVDRWAAVIGARKLYHGALCIIDVGTAVTVDLLAENNQHSGGRIFPGIKLMQQALASSTAAIELKDGNVTKFASNTADAVTGGTAYAVIAAVEQAVIDAQQILGAGMQTVITGGQADIIMQYGKQITVHHEPALVMHGLQAVAERG